MSRAHLPIYEGITMDSSHNTFEPAVAANPAPPVAILLDQLSQALHDLNEEVDALTAKIGPVLSPAPTAEGGETDKRSPIGYSEVSSRLTENLSWVRRMTMQVNCVKNSLEI